MRNKLFKCSLFQIISRTKITSAYKSFGDIPTLKSYPIVGHSYLFFPGGKYKAERLTESLLDISKVLGPIFRLKLSGIDMVITLDPDHTRILFQNEGQKPHRPSFPALIHYRQKTFNSLGVVPGNGDEWYRLRKAVTPLLKSQLVEQYKQQQEDVAKTFVEYIKTNRNHNFVLDDIYTHLLKYTIEAISIVSPGFRFHCMFTENTETREVIRASLDFMDGLYKTLIEPPIWKFWKTAGYKMLESSHNTIHKILMQHLKDVNKQFRDSPRDLERTNPYMFNLFKNESLSWEDKVMISMEIFLGGIDATATTIAFTLYYLSKNMDVQEMARASTTQGPEFLKACVRETLRLSPTAGGNSRFLINDIVLSDYVVPKGTLVLSLNSAMGSNETYFRQPQRYYPQRFLGGSKDEFHRFASLPFGHGPRMCPGKRIADNEIVILLAEILKAFRLEAVDDLDVGMVFRMNRVPDRPISLKFTNH